MPRLTFDNRVFECRPGETVLQTLLRHRVHLPYYCQVGSCKTCVIRVVDGPPPPDAQQSLLVEQIERGCFMACIAVADRDMVVALDDDEAS